MERLNLDTHVLLKALAGDVTPRERRLLSAHEWTISAIVLWEVAKLAALGRVTLDLRDPAVRRVVGAIPVWPLDLEVAVASTRLDFRGDPAAEIIAATSVVHRVPLLTRDTAILRSRVVPFPA
jgi:PIN domain nuclease of toxin-antitoxin system